jgi:hypothetical protein
MTGLVPAFHASAAKQDVDAWHKAGHDMETAIEAEVRLRRQRRWYTFRSKLKGTSP